MKKTDDVCVKEREREREREMGRERERERKSGKSVLSIRAGDEDIFSTKLYGLEYSCIIFIMSYCPHGFP